MSFLLMRQILRQISNFIILSQSFIWVFHISLRHVAISQYFALSVVRQKFKIGPEVSIISLCRFHLLYQRSLWKNKFGTMQIVGYECLHNKNIWFYTHSRHNRIFLSSRKPTLTFENTEFCSHTKVVLAYEINIIQLN